MFNLAIIGLGGWGRNLVKSVQGTSETVRFAAAVSRDPSRIADFCAENDLAAGGDYDAVLADPGIDGVVVASAGHLHAEHGRQAAAAGKHVMIIKPFANYRKDAEAVYEAADKSGTLAALGFDRCFAPSFRTLRARIGELGKILHAEGDFCVDRVRNYQPGDWKTNLESNPPGSLADHMLYTMVEHLGPIESLVSKGYSQMVDGFVDSSTVMMSFSGGASGSLTAIGSTARFERLHLFGSDGSAELRGNTEIIFQPLSGDAETVKLAATNMLGEQLETFAAAAQGKTAWPVPPEDAIAAVAALEAMRESHKTGAPVVL
jgi:predicted dehydrogenase